MLRLSCLQIPVGADKEQNLRVAEEYIRRVQPHSDLIVLPECFNSPYGTNFFPEYAEPIPSGPTITRMISLARELKILILVAGSIPERGDDGKFYNTSVVLNSEGTIIAKHRKMHLFDINVPGGIRFIESETLSPGNTITTFPSPWGTIGLGICYDMRFPHLASCMTEKHGAKILVYPAAFNTTTGPLHWELILRSRAVDFQTYVVACSPSRMPGAAYQAWGHSMIVSPWGTILASCDAAPCVVSSTLQMDVVDEVRMAIPCLAQRRWDVYRLDENERKEE